MKEEKEAGWRNIHIEIVKRTGRWYLGIAVQENDEGKKRLKIFKGLEKENGKITAEWKGEKIRLSMVQRINIPNFKYWMKLNDIVLKLLHKYLEEGQRSILEFQKNKGGR